MLNGDIASYFVIDGILLNKGGCFAKCRIFLMQINRSVLLQNEEIFSRFGQSTGIRTTMIQFKRQTFSYTEPCSFN